MPTKTSLPDSIGPLQQMDLQSALNATYDVTLDQYWVFHEGHKLVFRMTTEGQTRYQYGGGIRVVYQGGLIYTVMSVVINKPNSTPADDYDRAMSIVKR